MAGDWLIGAFTLGGALGGASLGGFISFRIQRDSEDRREAREAREAESAMLAAKRQIAGEIQSMTVALHAIATGDEEAEQFRHLLARRDRWDQYGSVLANDDSDVTVNAAYDIAEMLERHYARFDSERQQAEARDALTAALQAFKVLDPDKRLRRLLAAGIQAEMQQPESEPE